MIDYIKYNKQISNIESKRKEISELIIKNSTNIMNYKITKISSKDIELMFKLYDRIFFDNWFKENYKGKLNFSLSKRMTKSAGKTICPRNIKNITQEELILEIRMGVELFFNFDMIGGVKAVCGIQVNNSLEAMQLVFEHELCHVIEFIHYKESNCKRYRFNSIANNLFGHTESYHQLPTNKEIAREKFGLSLGDEVSFIFEGKKAWGILYKINKRATVMVLDKNGHFVDNKGKRYSKYYVNLSLLKGQLNTL
ncbi:hypothetical protein SH2C18_07610 [Clostridium sediminicola]|uniref:hypothetical protein n=1 Tax=Clostridium sediminicola TaxID=3114879 RepID=UPI0031F22EB1